MKLITSLAFFTSYVVANIRKRAISTAIELDRIQSCKSFVGDLTFKAGNAFDIDLNINSIVGDINVEGEHIKSVSFNMLETITGDLKFVDNSDLEVINLNKLSSIVGLFNIKNSKALKKINAPSFESMTGNIIFNDIPNIEAIGFPQLNRIVGNLFIQKTNTNRIELPKVEVICDKLQISEANKLISVKLNSFKAYRVKVNIDSNSLTELELGQMVAGDGSKIIMKDNKNKLSELNKQVEYSCRQTHYFGGAPNFYIPSAGVLGTVTFFINLI